MGDQLVNAVMSSPDWEHRDLPGLGRLGRLLRPRHAAHVDGYGYGLRVPALVISPYAKHGLLDHQTLSFDAYLKFIEDDFLAGSGSIRRPTAGPTRGPTCARTSLLGDLRDDFDFSQPPRPPADARTLPRGLRVRSRLLAVIPAG